MEENKIYKKEDVFKATLEYFKEDEMATDVWMKKYALKNTKGEYCELTPNDMHRRLAREFARIEQKYENPMSEEEIFDLIKNFTYIIPQGSPMAGIGNNFQTVSISNCFVIGNKSDSYGGIMKADEEQVQLMKRRGGVGHDLSHIRPKGSLVKNSAQTSTGVVPFMERYSNSTREVAQDGRRGACLISISINHPDAEDFIDAKMVDGVATGVNVSVKIDDNFMDSAINNKKYVQKFPVNSDNPSVFKEIKAKDLWNKIIHNSWKSAEPGILFIDTILRESVPDCYADLGYKTITTNPCLTKETWVLTDNGPKQIIDLIGKKYNALVNGIPYTSGDNGFFKTGIKPVYKITTGRGLTLKITEDHLIKKVLSENRGKKSFGWSKVCELKGGDKISINNNRDTISPFDVGNDKYNFETGWLLGSLLGDGTFNENHAILCYWGETKVQLKNNAVRYLNNNIKHRKDCGSGLGYPIKDKITIGSTGLFNFCNELDFHNNKIISKKIEGTNYDFYRGFFSGWFDADGTVSKNKEKGFTVRLACSDLDNLEIAQRMLLRLGIFSTIAKNRRQEGYRKMPDGHGGLKEYLTKANHELIISKDNVLYFNKLIGFKDDTKQKVLSENIKSVDKRGFYKEKFIDMIKSIDYCGNEDVYDCQIPIINEFDANGLNVHNCGEIPLCPYDSCRLLVLNLYSYVENPFTIQAFFNNDLFIKNVRYAQRLMDDIIDLELEKIDKILEKINSDSEPENIKKVEKDLWIEIKHKCEEGRRCGLGITGEGDMLAAMGLVYGSDNGIQFSENVQKTLKLEAYRSSVNLAKERGAFKIYDSGREKENPFINRIKEDDIDLYNEMVKHGRRNIALLTISPTGSVSIMAQTTSGIEPTFLVNYTRRRKINPQEKGVKVDFVDKKGDSWQEYNVLHHKFEVWLKVSGYDVETIKKMSVDDINKIIEKSPYYKSTSADIDWVKKVEMQGKMQAHIDHSTSCTVNLPSDATEELVAKVYETGWRHGCKGITVYRDGCRSGVLIQKKEKKDTNFETHAPKRPKVLNADVFTFQNNFEKWVAIIGKLAATEGGQETPYELFTGKLDSFLIPPYVTKGQVIKRKADKASSYDFKYIDKDGYPQEMLGLSRSFDEEFWNYAKLISAILRHGMPIPYVINVVNGLKLNSDSLNTWKNGVIRMLKKYVKDGTESGDTCEICGAKLLYVEGCLKCQSCGFSKC